MPVDETSIEIPLAEPTGAAKGSQKTGIATRADDNGVVERGREPLERLVTAAAMCDQLSDQRVIIRRDLAAGLDAAVDAQALALGKL